MTRFLSFRPFRMTQREYRANLDGLNIFFGAVLGFVLAGAETLSPFAFTLLLIMTASIVITILYISSSDHRLTYTMFAIAVIATLPLLPNALMPGVAFLPRNLQPTLAVWLGMTIFVEFAPRTVLETTPSE
jgi:hypothetical protein